MRALRRIALVMSLGACHDDPPEDPWVHLRTQDACTVVPQAGFERADVESLWRAADVTGVQSSCRRAVSAHCKIGVTAALLFARDERFAAVMRAGNVISEEHDAAACDVKALDDGSKARLEALFAAHAAAERALRRSCESIAMPMIKIVDDDPPR